MDHDLIAAPPLAPSHPAPRRLALRGLLAGLGLAAATVTAGQGKGRRKRKKTGKVIEVQGQSATVAPGVPRVFLEATCVSSKQLLIGGGFTCTDGSGSSTGVEVAESRLLNDGGGKRFALAVRNPMGPSATCTAYAHCMQ